MPASEQRDATGITGLDEILGGGLPAHKLYLVQGDTGAGKTTLGLEFAINGAQAGEPVLYVTTSESEEELQQVARSHGWSLEGVVIFRLQPPADLNSLDHQTMFYPGEVELPKMMESLLAKMNEVVPERLVIDSLSEIRGLARDEYLYRRWVLLLKEWIGQRECCTTVLLDAAPDGQHVLRTIVSGVIDLEQLSLDYGPDRRRLRISKLRGQPFASGYHDFKIQTGGISLFPRFIVAEHPEPFEPALVSSGLPELDSLLGGGLDQGTTTLLSGSTGTGKSLTAAQYAVSAAERGERAVMYVFEERIQTVLQRCRGIGLEIQKYIGRGKLDLRQVDLSDVTPGELSRDIRTEVIEKGTRMIVLDSLNAFLHALPDQQIMMTLLHELFSYLNQQAVTSLIVLAQYGPPLQSRIDISYFADTVLIFRHFEHAGEVHTAVSVQKRRGGSHERTIRELQFGSRGLVVGEPLTGFEGILSGRPRFVGDRLEYVQGSDE